MKGFILPHPPIAVHEVGKGKEKEIQRTIDSFMAVAEEIAELKPETIIVITPHGTTYSDYIHIAPGENAGGSLSAFGAHSVTFNCEYDTELVEAISKNAYTENIPAGTLGEKSKLLDHGTIVPLYFVNKLYTDYRLVRISISGLPSVDHYRFGKAIRKAVDECSRSCVIIASGDLSHKLKEDGPYGFSEEGSVFDNEITKGMKDADFLRFLLFSDDECERAAQCGLQSFNILAGYFDRKQVSSKFLSYEGTFGVGYAICVFEETGIDDSRNFDEIAESIYEEKCRQIREIEDEYVRLARNVVENYVKYRKRIGKPDDLCREILNNRAGVFVTLKINGRLRGCIGTISPVTSCIAEEIIRNGISACSEDPRFDPVTCNELPYIIYSVDVLGEAEKVNSLEELDPKTYGVIVSKGRRRGLLLPDLEGVDTVSEQIRIALQKADIDEDENYTIERFRVIRHK